MQTTVSDLWRIKNKKTPVTLQTPSRYVSAASRLALLNGQRRNGAAAFECDGAREEAVTSPPESAKVQTEMFATQKTSPIRFK